MTRPASPAPLTGPRWPAALLALALMGLYSFYSFLQWRHFVIPSWDLGIFSQLAKAYSQGQVPIVPIKGEGFNLLGDHFHPLTLLLGPFYWLWPTPATLLYVQNGLLALSVYLLVRYAQQLLGIFSALALAGAYALSFGVQQAVAVQFHEVAFALPLLVGSLGNLALARSQASSGRLARSVYWAVPLVFVKEDMGVTVFVLGLVILGATGFYARAWKLLRVPQKAGQARIRGLVDLWFSTPQAVAASLLALWGLALSALAVGVILPFFNTGGVFDYSDKLDLAALVSNPLAALGQLFYPWAKTQTLLLLLVTGALAWVASPLALVAAPTLIWRFLSPQEGYWEPTWHYSLVLMPVVFCALLDALVSWRARGVDLSLGGFSLLKTLPALSLLLALLLLPSQPLKNLTKPAFTSLTLSQQDQDKTAALAAIPQGSRVAADLSILTYLVPQHTAYWIGHAGEPAPDYVVLDLLGTAWGGNPPSSAVDYANSRYPASYQPYRSFGSIQIAVRQD